MSEVLLQLKNGLLLFFGLFGLRSVTDNGQIEIDAIASEDRVEQILRMNDYIKWMAIGTAVIFALYGVRCLLARKDKPIRKWAMLTAFIALALTVRLTLEFARIGYIVLTEGALDFEAEEFELGYILEDLFTFDLTGLSFFCGAAGVFIAVLLANLLTRRRAAIAGMDAFALGLIKAYQLIEDGRIDAFIEKRYASYREGIGKRIVEGKETLESLAAYAADLKNVIPDSGRQEYLETVFNQILFNGKN